MTWKSYEQQEAVACAGIYFKWLRKTTKCLSVVSALSKVRTGKLPNTSVTNLAIIFDTMSYKIHFLFLFFIFWRDRSLVGLGLLLIHEDFCGF
jgi:hypothetical protein